MFDKIDENVTIRLTINEDYMRDKMIEFTYDTHIEFLGALTMLASIIDVSKLEFKLNAVEFYDISMNFDDCDKLIDNCRTLGELSEYIDNLSER